MNLAVTCIREVNAVIDLDGIPLVRIAVIWCGLALNTFAGCAICRSCEGSWQGN